MSKSTLDSLKGVFKVFRRKPSLGASVYCVYCVFLCGTNKLEPKKPDALCVQPPFLVWEPQKIFFTQNDAFIITDRGTVIDEVSTKRIHIEEKIEGHFLTCGLRVAWRNKLLWALWYANVSLGCRHRSELVGSARKRPLIDRSRSVCIVPNGPVWKIVSGFGEPGGTPNHHQEFPGRSVHRLQSKLRWQKTLQLTSINCGTRLPDLRRIAWCLGMHYCLFAHPKCSAHFLAP